MPRPLYSGQSSAWNSLQFRLRRSTDIFRSGRYIEASVQFQEDYEAAKSAGENRIAARFLGNLGACRLALREYGQALEAFDAARRLAEAAGDTSTAGAMDANASSVYEQTGDLDTAVEYARRGVSRLSGRDRARHLPKVLIQLASLRARQGRMDEAAALFAQGIDGADRAGDLETWALGQDRLGEEHLKRHDLAAAEGPLLEAFRARKLHRLAAIETSYRNLGRLRFEQGDLRSAETLLDQAVERMRAPRGLMPAWDIYHTRGGVRMARGEHRGAIEDLRIAVRLARAWRAGVSPADATRLAGEQMVERAYAALAGAAAGLYFQTGDAGLRREAFEAVEENRALSLRALAAEAPGRREALPPGYWESLAQLQRAEAALVRKPRDSATLARAETLLAALVGMENRAGGSLPATETGLLGKLQHSLSAGSAWFSFQLGEPESYVWAVDRGACELYRLPGRAALAASVREFAAAVRDGAPTAKPLGAELYRILFGTAGRRFTGKPRWLLALDEELFELPVAALRQGNRYLAELHSIRAVPAAGLAARTGQAGWSALLDGSFVGLGDPVYNTADARGPGGSVAGLELPRLVGSGREIELCAAAWSRPGAVLLSGRQANKGHLREALRSRPAVVHLATHVVESARRSRHGLIALTLEKGKGADILDPLEIAAWGSGAGLVVLSGCSSGAGQALPGSGLMGLTRAWLASGAAAVAATRWSTTDGDGALLRSFYRHLRKAPGEGPAEALGRAQVEMLGAGGWRAEPRYWGAYFLVASQ
ncbi:MAG TPA: CHAT domain-containing protein [Bryobacteraceae bacterium]|nr:CHAT domain-containing protein [Bryobacteraceae bacterium]